MRQRNPEARCGNCVYGETDRVQREVICDCMPVKSRRCVGEICGQHPEFFLPDSGVTADMVAFLKRALDTPEIAQELFSNANIPPDVMERVVGQAMEFAAFTGQPNPFGDSEPSTVMATAKVVIGRDGA